MTWLGEDSTEMAHRINDIEETSERHCTDMFMLCFRYKDFEHRQEPKHHRTSSCDGEVDFSNW